MDEPNRRKALLYTHPTVANCCRNLIPRRAGLDTARELEAVDYGNAQTHGIVE